jgi:hypothetical protein
MRRSKDRRPSDFGAGVGNPIGLLTLVTASLKGFGRRPFSRRRGAGRRAGVRKRAFLFTDLQAAINRFLDDHNARSKPFQWVADPDKIIAAVRRGHQALDSIR